MRGKTPLTLVRRRLPQDTEARVRAKTAQFGFGADKAETPIANLSGGEKARLLLGLAAFDGPHLLILDEPTNHLDIPMRDALVEALAEYKGAVIIVSHDRGILDASCDRLWLVTEGQVKAFDGDLDDYEALVVSGRGGGSGRAPGEGKSRDGARESSSLDARAAKAERRAALKPLKDRAETLEAQVAKYQGLLERIDIALSAPDLFSKFPDKAKQLTKNRADLVKHIEQTEELWLAVMAEIEAPDGSHPDCDFGDNSAVLAPPRQASCLKTVADSDFWINLEIAFAFWRRNDVTSAAGTDTGSGGADDPSRARSRT